MQILLPLAERVAALGLRADWTPRPELYLAGDRLDEFGLRREAEARSAAGLPGRSSRAVPSAFGT